MYIYVIIGGTVAGLVLLLFGAFWLRKELKRPRSSNGRLFLERGPEITCACLVVFYGAFLATLPLLYRVYRDLAEYVGVILALVAAVGVAVAQIAWIVRALMQRVRGVDRTNIVHGLLVALMTVALVFVLTYLSAWVGLRHRVATGDCFPFFAEDQRIQVTLKEYRQEHGQYPESLDELPGANYPLWYCDGWGHRYHYTKTDGEYKLLTYGRDGQPGGVGLDADIELGREGHALVTPTLGL